MTPVAFAAYCGPQALAHVIGGGYVRAARRLLAMQRIRRRLVAPMVFDADMVLLAMRAGLSVERWSVDRPEPLLIESHADLAARLVAELEHDRQPRAREDFQRQRAAVAELTGSIPDLEHAVQAMRTAAATRCFTLAEWLDRPGRWLLAVSHELFEGGLAGHFVATLDGRVVAGDSPAGETYARHPLCAAYKFTPR